MAGFRAAGRYGAAGLEVFVGVAVGFFLGRYLDREYFGGRGYAMMVFLVLGTVAGFRNLFRASREVQRQLEREDREAFPYEKEYLAQNLKADRDEARSEVHREPGDTSKRAGDP
jgi:ATP synthase protein I